MFDLKRPCKNCPWLKELGPKFQLHPDRIREIVNASSFSCHKTVNYDAMEEDENGECETQYKKSGAQQCAGLIAMLWKQGEMNQITQVATRLTDFDPSRIDGSEVYDSVEEAIRSHSLED